MTAPAVEWLSPEDRLAFEHQGYLVLRNMISEGDCDVLRRESNRIMRRRTMKKRERKAGGTFDSFRNCLALSDTFLPLLTHPVVLGAVLSIMGPNIRLTTSQLVFRHPDPLEPPLPARVAKWHRDMAPATEDLGHDKVPLLQIKCMYYLTDAREAGRGSSLVVPGSNRASCGPELDGDGLDPDGAVELQLGPGDCLLFENRTWHAGGPNLSTDIRKALIFGYGYRWLHAHDFNAMPPRLADRLTEAERFLLGENPPGPAGFRVGGWRNPLREALGEPPALS